MVIEKLTRPQKIRAKIDAKAWELEEARAMAYSMGGGPEICKVNGERQVMDKVKSSHSGDALPRSVIRIVERTEELEELQAEYDRALRAAGRMIDILSPVQYRLMHMLYIEGMTIADTAAELCISTQTARNYKTAALARLEEETEAKS